MYLRLKDIAISCMKNLQMCFVYKNFSCTMSGLFCIFRIKSISWIHPYIIKESNISNIIWNFVILFFINFLNMFYWFRSGGNKIKDKITNNMSLSINKVLSDIWNCNHLEWEVLNFLIANFCFTSYKTFLNKKVHSNKTNI